MVHLHNTRQREIHQHCTLTQHQAPSAKSHTSLHVSCRVKSKAKQLSLGETRRLSLAIALVADPQLLFLDEPTSGLDPESKRNIWQLIDRFKTGRSIVNSLLTSLR